MSTGTLLPERSTEVEEEEEAEVPCEAVTGLAMLDGDVFVKVTQVECERPATEYPMGVCDKCGRSQPMHLCLDHFLAALLGHIVCALCGGPVRLADVS